MPVVPTTINSEAEWAADGAKQAARSRKSSNASSMQEPLLSSPSAVILVASANSTGASEAPVTEYKLYPVRWWILFLFCLIAFGQSLIWISFSPITPQAMDYYNCSEASIDLLLNWGTICYVLFAIVCARWGRTAQGLRKMMYAAAVFEIFAVLLRLVPVFIYHERLQPYAIYFAHAAHISNALACPPISVTVTKVSCVWFGAHERVAATAVAVVSNNMGTAVGMIVAPYIVAEGHPEQVPRLLYVHAAFGALLGICIFSYLPVRPPTHPSPAAEQMFATRPAPFGPSFRAALKNVHLVLLALCAGAVTGIFNTWSGILATAMPADAFNQTTVGWFAAGATLSAIAGGIFHALLLAWHPRLRRELKTLIIILIWAALGCGVWFSLSLASVFSDRPILGGFSTSLPSLGMAICLLGWFVGSSYPLAFELAVEMTYPMQESVSGGVLSIVSNGIGVIFLFVAPSMSGAAMNATMVATIATAAIAVPLVHDQYIRADAEEKVKGDAASRAGGASGGAGAGVDASAEHSVNGGGVEKFSCMMGSHGVLRSLGEMDDGMHDTHTLAPLESTASATQRSYLHPVM